MPRKKKPFTLGRLNHTDDAEALDSNATHLAIKELSAFFHDAMKADRGRTEDAFARVEGLMTFVLTNIARGRAVSEGLSGTNLLTAMGTDAARMAENAARLSANILVQDGSVSEQALMDYLATELPPEGPLQ